MKKFLVFIIIIETFIFISTHVSDVHIKISSEALKLLNFDTTSIRSYQIIRQNWYEDRGKVVAIR
jgi:hypothetical protein